LRHERECAYGELEVVAVVPRLAALDRLAGLRPLDRIDWIGAVDRLDRLGGLGLLDLLGGLAGLGDVLPQPLERDGEEVGAAALGGQPGAAAATWTTESTLYVLEVVHVIG
jgi:hypothetical protein